VRIRLLLTITTASLCGILAGCSSFSIPDVMPDWFSSRPSPPPLQTLQFESNPPGAEVRTLQGQSCRTPCSLAVPVESQSVSFAMNGFLPQTVQVDVQAPTEHALFASAPPPTLIPNPVGVSLQPAGPPRRAPGKPHRTSARTAPPPAATR
jgi:hypothetical protein